jgi:hypothetical protein
MWTSVSPCIEECIERGIRKLDSGAYDRVASGPSGGGGGGGGGGYWGRGGGGGGGDGYY